MSHIVVVKTVVRDVAAVRAACKRFGLAEPVHGETKQFSGQAEGLIVRLPNWQYPVVCNMTSGEVQYDNFGGRWGDQTHLDHFLQAYAVEKCRIEARTKGHGVTEHALSDGSITLTVQIEGGAA